MVKPKGVNIVGTPYLIIKYRKGGIVELEKGKTLARELMDSHGLKEFQLIISHGKRTVGYCNIRSKQIAISKHFIKGSYQESVKKVILHEIAHALDFYEYGNWGHGETFKALCKQLGTTGQSMENIGFELEKPQPKYTVYCPNHGVVGHRNRKTKGNYVCNKCHEKVTFKQNY